MKTIIYVIIALMLTSLCYAVQCEETISIGQNCTMLSPELTTCTNYNYEIYSLAGYIANGSLSVVNDSIYSLLFNYTQAEGGYIVKVCDGSTREIYVKGDESMIYLWFALVVGIALMVLGLYSENYSLSAIGGFVFLTLGLWIFTQGYGIYINMITSLIGVVFIGCGGYFLIMSVLSLIEKGYGD